MYARNVATFLAYMVKDGKLQLNLQDEIIRETMVTRGGEIVNARVREFFKLPALVAGGSVGCSQMRTENRELRMHMHDST